MGIHIPTDVLILFLSRLPIGNILALRSVSRLWNDTIVNELVREERHGRSYILLNDKRTGLLRSISVSEENLNLGDAEDLSLHMKGTIIGSCQGLLLFKQLKGIALVNPATDQFNVIPPMPSLNKLQIQTGNVAYGLTRVNRGFFVFAIAMSTISGQKRATGLFNVESNTWSRMKPPEEDVRFAYDRDMENWRCCQSKGKLFGRATHEMESKVIVVDILKKKYHLAKTPPQGNHCFTNQIVSLLPDDDICSISLYKDGRADLHKLDFGYKWGLWFSFVPPIPTGLDDLQPLLCGDGGYGTVLGRPTEVGPV